LPDGELFIHYHETDSKVLVLGIGKSHNCAEQVARAWEENSALKKLRLRAKLLRPPKAGFLLR